MNYSKKEVTYGDKTYLETTGTCTLKSVSDNLLENVNGTEYALATIEFENEKGEKKEVGAMVYKANLQDADGNIRMEVGEKYLFTARKIVGEKRPPLVFVSHLQGTAERASDDDFGFNTEIEAPAAVKTEVPATANTLF